MREDRVVVVGEELHGVGVDADQTEQQYAGINKVRNIQLGGKKFECIKWCRPSAQLSVGL